MTTMTLAPAAFFRLMSRGGFFGWLGLALLLAMIGMAVFAPLISPYDPLEQSIVMRLMPPSADHLFGTDSFGRDVLSRVIYGARVSLVVGFVSILIAMTLGTLIGVISGYVGGRFDQFVMAVADVMLSFPSLLLGLLVAAVLGSSLENLIIAIAVTEIAPFIRLARAPTLALKEREFIEAGRALGFGHARLMGVHILPNLLSDILIMGSLWMATAIRTEASLSFIGLGVRPPTPTW
ncbi:MAG: ABC transporter permease, partial [Candidimonas sp.]